MMQPSRGSRSTGQTDRARRIIIQENGLWNLRYGTQLDNETLGTPQGIFFTSIKNIQLNAFSFGQEGWSYFFPLSFPQKVSSWILASFFFSCFLSPVFTPSHDPQCLHTLLMEITHVALGNAHYQGKTQWLHWVMHWWCFPRLLVPPFHGPLA